MSVQTALFSAIHQNSLIYNTCWEDPRVDRCLLGLNKDSKVLMLTSAGCNALDYLIDDPAQIFCVDLNYRQNALLELKKTFFQHSDQQTLFAAFGACKLNRSEVLYRTRIRPHLDLKVAEFWDSRIKSFEQTQFRRSFYYTGGSGVVALALKRIIRAQPSLRKLVEELFHAKSIEEQSVIYNQIEPLIFKPAMSRIFNSALVQSMIGVPQAQRKLARAIHPDGMTGYMRHAFRKVFTTLPITDNYFYYIYLFGHYTPEICPEYLKSVHFQTIKQRVCRVKTFTTSLTEFLKSHPGKYTHFILLDHQDWMANHAKEALVEEWQYLLRNAAPGARVLFRSASHDRSFLPEFVHQYLTFDDDLVRAHEPRDRVGTYATTHLAYVK